MCKQADSDAYGDGAKINEDLAVDWDDHMRDPVIGEGGKAGVQHTIDNSAIFCYGSQPVYTLFLRGNCRNIHTSWPVRYLQWDPRTKVRQIQQQYSSDFPGPIRLSRPLQRTGDSGNVTKGSAVIEALQRIFRYCR